MSRHNRPFRFKQFEVFHHRSSMKIGVDAVILGSWADFQYATSILDAGCGCGVISLMAAQRNKDAKVFAIDIDAESVDESNANFSTSPWCDRRRLNCQILLNSVVPRQDIRNLII